MATTQIGSTLDLGAGTLTGYIVESVDHGDFEVDNEKINDGADGSLKTILIFGRYQTVTLNLVALTGTSFLADFPKGLKAAHTGSIAAKGGGTTITLSSCMVEECKATASKSGTRLVVTLKNYGI